jgi:hypothetical protein
MNCQCCLQDVDVLKEWKGESYCPDCYESFVKLDEEKERSGLDYDQFFRRKLLDIMEKRYSKFAYGN